MQYSSIDGAGTPSFWSTFTSYSHAASGLYRLLARKMRGYADAHADQIFRDLIDMPATVTVAADQVTVRFHHRAHPPIIIDSGMLDSSVSVPWWNGVALRLTA
jgi:hypothetical protein